MTVPHGKGAILKVADAGDVLRDISQYVTESALARTRDMAETSAYGTGDKSYIPGMRDGRLPITGNYDPTATTGPDAVMAALIANDLPHAFEWYPGGLGTGQIKYSGSALIASLEERAPSTDKVGFTAELQVTGAVARAVL